MTESVSKVRASKHAACERPLAWGKKGITLKDGHRPAYPYSDEKKKLLKHPMQGEVHNRSGKHKWENGEVFVKEEQC